MVALTETSRHLRLIRLDTRKLILGGDEACAGIHIANSEIGFRPVTIDALVYRLVCTNGLVRLVKGQSLFHRRHVGTAWQQTQRSLEDAIATAMRVGTHGLERFAAATREPIDEPAKLLANNADRWQLSDDLQEDILRRLGYEPPALRATRYGLVNAITSAAQLEEPDERYRLETLAGRILERA